MIVPTWGLSYGHKELVGEGKTKILEISWDTKDIILRVFRDNELWQATRTNEAFNAESFSI